MTLYNLLDTSSHNTKVKVLWSECVNGNVITEVIYEGLAEDAYLNDDIVFYNDYEPYNIEIKNDIMEVYL